MTERMNNKPVLAIAICLFLLYVIVTVVQMFPIWAGLSGTEVFALLKHLAVVLGITAFLFFKPQIGCFAAVAWGLIVPLERYRLLVEELLRGSLFESGVLAPLDTARLLLLFLGTCTSALLTYQLRIRNKEAPASANA